MATDPRIIHNPFRKVGAGIIASAALQHAGDSSSAAASESTQQPESHFSEFFNRVFNGVRRFYLWPSIFAFAVGYKVGIKAALKQIATATTRRTTEVVVSGPLITIRSFLLKAALLALITREFWRVIPAWVKRQLPFVGEPKKTIELEDPNDLSSITALSLKLQSLFHQVSQKLGNDSSDSISTRVSVLAMLRLIAQVKYQAPDFRDEAYDQTGLTVEDPSKELEGLDEAFDFADWAYDEFTYEETLAKSLANRGFSLVRHDKTTLPGCVAHYIAISKERKIALIGIKGTSHFEDLLTDCCGQAIQHDLGSSFVEGGPTEISCHEGIFAAANRLANDIEVLLDELLLPNKYNLLVTGHSLGAGVAALLGVILRSRIPALRRNEEKRLKVLAFASPPILDHDSALACNDFCTTIVNNSDVIPRSSVCNLMIMVEFLKIVGTKLDEKDMSLTSFESAGAFLKMLTDDLDGQMLLAPDEIKAGMRAATEKVELRDPQHLYVAGKILHMYDLWSKTTTEDTDKPSIETRTAERLTITDGTSSMLRYIEMDDRMITDHLSPCYRSSIKCLLQKV